MSWQGSAIQCASWLIHRALMQEVGEQFGAEQLRRGYHVYEGEGVVTVKELMVPVVVCRRVQRPQPHLHSTVCLVRCALQTAPCHSKPLHKIAIAVGVSSGLNAQVRRPVSRSDPRLRTCP